jgi:hypothetical protein
MGKVSQILQDIKEFDADEFQELLEGLAIQAREVSQIEPIDDAWVDTAGYLTLSAKSCRNRRSN